MMRIGIASALATILCVAQVPAAAKPAPRAAPTASAADLAGIDRTVRAVYEVISGPAGQKRDFAKMRSLFAPNALLRAIGPKGVRGGSLEDYIVKSGPLLERDGFTESELGRRTEVYGNLASVWSAYDGRTANGSFHERGINSIQLVRVEGAWLVASILWAEENAATPLPVDLEGKR